MIKDLTMVELPALDVDERSRRQDRSEILAHHVRLVRGPAHGRSELGDPRNGLVALIPQAAEATAVNQDPMNILQCQGRIEPVERLRHDDTVNGRVP